ncbi:uncharacterized protein [Dysidea avara]|uniref:uncharacterized protein n=1 Tax=Dysidea avara TaxID=196820 RepID=UPI00332A745F
MNGLVAENVVLEDDHHRPKFIPTLWNILLCCVTTSLWLIISVACLPLFLLGLLIWGLSPTIPVPSTFWNYFIATFKQGKLEENIPFTNRVLLLLIYCDILVKVPVNGVCWYIDELLYPSYHKVNIDEPVFMITAPRTGSSQLCQYLEDDYENIIAPTVGEGLFPYIWMWKILVPVIKTLGKEHCLIRHFDVVGTEAKRQHNSSLFKSATFDDLARSWHFEIYSWYLGSSFLIWAFSYVELGDKDYQRNFVPFTNCLMKKIVYYRGKPKQRVLLKGHFLLNARKFEQQYPTAKFFVSLRNPLDRMCSYANLEKVLVDDGPYKIKYGLFPTTWRVIRDYVIYTQIPYCEQEMLFYKDPANNKLVIPFTMYVNNLSATLQCIYSFCNIPIPDDVVSSAIRLQNTTHNYRYKRKQIDCRYRRTLTSLGVNEAELRKRLSEYIEWISKFEDN